MKSKEPPAKKVKNDRNESPVEIKIDIKQENAENTNENGNNKIVIDLTKISNNWSKIKKNAIEEHNKLKERMLKIKSFRAKKKGKLNVNESKKDEKNNENTKIWFEVDHIFIPQNEEIKTTKQEDENTTSHEINIKKPSIVDTNAKLTRVIAIDCEMVGVGEDGRDSILARVSLVNQLNQCIYDKYVLPTETVTDYRTHVSGVRPEDLKKANGAEKFDVVQKEVSELIKDRIIVGHAIHNDFKVLFLSHPKKKIRDTQRCKLFRKLKPSLGGFSSLKTLAQVLLGVSIQEGEHSSVQDAQAAMRIYTMYRKEWEAEIRSTKAGKKSKIGTNEQSDVSIAVATQQTAFNIKGNDKHKRYIENKLKRRNKTLKFKK